MNIAPPRDLLRGANECMTHAWTDDTQRAEGMQTVRQQGKDRHRTQNQKTNRLTDRQNGIERKTNKQNGIERRQTEMTVRDREEDKQNDRQIEWDREEDKQTDRQNDLMIDSSNLNFCTLSKFNPICSPLVTRPF